MDSPLKVLYMNGYSGCWVDADYGSVSQKWLLIHSEQATKREQVTFYKNLDKNITKELKALGQLKKKQFACAVDAEQAMSHIELARWADYLLIAPTTANFFS